MTLIEQEKLIKWTLVVFWSCRACHALGWDVDCVQKGLCGSHLYKKLGEHYRRRIESAVQNPKKEGN